MMVFLKFFFFILSLPFFGALSQAATVMLFSQISFWIQFQDKSADVRKAAEVCLNEILRACCPEMVD